MFQSRRQRKLKNSLSLLLKVLLVVAVLVKLFDWDIKEFFSGAAEDKTEIKTLIEEKDTLTIPLVKADSPLIEAQKSEVAVNPTPNSASIYIFNKTGLDKIVVSHVENTFFTNYKVKAGGSVNKSRLLNGDLSSSASTEVVCVGSTDYSFYTNSQQLITCKLHLFFDTYNKNTGTKLQALSQSYSVSGVGFTDAEALKVALRKIHL
ncbi:Hypothetical protein I595_2532 [Croceitalea dokdonensis DOKDO 023]|uniref:Uncharacterized protein n=1 Tax=Croceitalea dokdonensis DOKDO 023 TaxID=1300341 RepID=A0A0P7AS39_9FLAO|nr:hypothetical protein [Croceitalea dokdonensis]KPM31267.1 Hypothetical protein I595_2532 [Croceitalea dokdonensis DOKDO 023]